MERKRLILIKAEQSITRRGKGSFLQAIIINRSRQSRNGEKNTKEGTSKSKRKPNTFRRVPRQIVSSSAITGWEGLRDARIYAEHVLWSRRDLSSTLLHFEKNKEAAEQITVTARPTATTYKKQRARYSRLYLLRPSFAKFPCVLIQKCQTTVYRGFFDSLRYSERKQKLLRAQQNQEGDTDTVTVYLVLAKKYDVAFQNCQTTVYRVFFASLRYIERK